MKQLARALLTMAALIVAFRLLERRGVKPHGSLLGMPYDFRPPTLKRAVRSVWDPSDDRLLVPRFFGWGYSPNAAAILRQITGVPRRHWRVV